MKPLVSKDDLERAVAQGMYPTQLANELGVECASVCRAEERHQVRLIRCPKDSSNMVPSVRQIIEDMKPMEAVEFLLTVIGDITGTDREDEQVFWPDACLTRIEARVFRALLRWEGHPVSQERLYELVYPGVYDGPHIDTLRVHVWRLRRKIEGRGVRIETVRGVGLRLVRTPGTVFPWEDKADG